MIGKRQSEKSARPFEIVMRGCQLATPRGEQRGQADQMSNPKSAAAPANSELRIANWDLKRLSLLATRYLLLAVLAASYSLLAVAPAFAQTKTTVSDTIHAPDGSLPSGRIVIKSESTFTAADGTVVFQGTVATTTVTNGAFSVALVPTAGSMPAGASYQALYELLGVPYHTEIWNIPSSASPVTLADVRSASLASPSSMVASSQMPALSGAVTSQAGSTVTTFAAPAITTSITDKGGQLFNVKSYGAAGNGTADDTSAVNAAFSAAYAAGGGIIYFPPGTYLIAGALTIPNDGAAHPQQPPYRMMGAGMQVDGTWGKPAANGSVLVLTETSDTVGKIDTRGNGYMEISGLSFTDTAADSVPFIFTTNTTIHVHDCGFTSSQTGTANVQDAVVLGGTNPADIHTGNADAPFQGYGTVVTRNFFAQVRHAVVGNTYANGVQITENTVGDGSGSSTSGDAPFVFTGYASGSQGDTGGYISGNLIEIGNYYYGVRLAQYDESFTMMGNNTYDGGANTVATYYLGTASDTEMMSCGETAGGQCIDTTSPGASGQNYVAFGMSLDSSGNSSYIGNHPFFPHGLTIRSGNSINLQTLVGQQTQIYEQSYSTYIQPNDGSAYDSLINHKGQWGILNTSPQVAFDVNGSVRTRPMALASAPACGSTIEGSMQAISDSTTATWGATITGGGTNHVLAYCDGTAWTVMGK